jgi:hypothetical protein
MPPCKELAKTCGKTKETFNNNKGCVHTVGGLAIYIKKYLKAKEEELWKLKYFTMQKIYIIFKKKSSKRNQNPSSYYNSIANLKFLQHKPKTSSFKNPHIKIDLFVIT